MRQRKYPYGAISRGISAVMGHWDVSAPFEIMQLVRFVYDIDRDTTRRNLRSMACRGLIRNVGTRQKALYVLREKA